MIFDLKLIAIASAAAFSIGALSGTYITNKYKNGIFAQQILEQERQAALILEEERNRAIGIERKLSQEKDKLEIEHAKNANKIRTLTNQYTTAVNNGKRLRDPVPGKGCENGMSSDSRPSPESSSGGGTGILSAEASRFLLNEASRADQVLNDLSLCKTWVKQVKKSLTQK